jgi:hypothetical protein
MNLIERVLSDKVFETKPPLLIDIGASGEIDKKWKRLAKFSICLAFDADDREIAYITNESSDYKKLILYNCIVKDTDEEQSDFYLTKSPFCSSLLEPDIESLKVYSFSDKFRVESIAKLKSRSITSILEEQNLSYIDWFKTDSQGTDLRLFKAIPDNIRNNILVSEFEPGLIDSYKEEDKMFSVMSYMGQHQFWLADLVIKGSQRISQSNLDLINSNNICKKLLSYSLKESPGWGEMLYFNNFNNIEGKRELLLGWVFASINLQYGFALEIVNKGIALFNDDIFKKMKKYTILKLRTNVFKLRFLPALFRNYINK